MAASQGAAGGEVAFRGAMGVGGVAVDLDEVGVARIAVAPEEGVVDRCGGVVERCAVECKVGDDMAVGDAAIIEVYAALVVGGVVGDKAVAELSTAVDAAAVVGFVADEGAVGEGRGVA